MKQSNLDCARPQPLLNRTRNWPPLHPRPDASWRSGAVGFNVGPNLNVVLRLAGLALPALATMQCLAESRWTQDVRWIAFQTGQARLPEEGSNQIHELASWAGEKCDGFPIDPIVVVTAVLSNQATPGDRELAASRVSSTLSALVARGFTGRNVFFEVLPADKYIQKWSAAPERVKAPIGSVEVELACRPK